MTVKRPTLEQMSDIVESLGMTMTKERVGEFISLMDGSFAAYDIVDQMADEIPVVKYPRTPGYRPSPEENPLNAWYVKTDIQGAPKGKLKGKTVAVKDNVCVAGVPMMNGSSTLEGYIPNIDATIVTRLLDAGAVIKGKAHCECFCLSGGSHTGALGHVHNPHKRGYSAGGSSSGSGALVAAGEVDLAIGGDQGGSIRMPASFCGVYGMKPTHGLVPYTGVMPIEATRSYWPDYGNRRRQRADAGSSGGARRPRPASVCAQGRRLFCRGEARREGAQDRRGQGRIRPRQ
jgi:amidase